MIENQPKLINIAAIYNQIQKQHTNLVVNYLVHNMCSLIDSS
jgi:hypothetical protein